MSGFISRDLLFEYAKRMQLCLEALMSECAFAGSLSPDRTPWLSQAIDLESFVRRT
jgi:hypothetical protein